MIKELKKEGVDVVGVTVMAAAFASNLQPTVSKTDQPVLKDTIQTNAWAKQQFGKDHWMVYDKNGKLYGHYPPGGNPKITLASSIGYKSLKKILASLW